jgi:PPOX class probable F420-dependent enzyme
VTADEARRLLSAQRVARLATVAPSGRPHIVPIVFAVRGDTIYSAVDAKPKRTTALQRLANVAATGHACVLADHYDDGDWRALWWVRADGVGRVLAAPADDDEATLAVRLLQVRYPQHRAQPPSGPVLAVDVGRWSGWRAAPGAG